MFIKKKAKNFNDVWRQRNPNNRTMLYKNTCMDDIIVGCETYGTLNVENANPGCAKLIIGSYVSIGPYVHFILTSEHPYKGLSTYPFKFMFNDHMPEAISKGDIVIEDDVWIGLGVIINSGVCIGKGSIIASGSVVVKDVEPYSIVGGNPAKFIKYRFSKQIIEKLKQFDLTKLSRDIIVNNIDLLYTEITDENIDDILARLKGN